MSNTDSQAMPNPDHEQLNADAYGSLDASVDCPNCGEQCREGLLRCWNCGVFLRQEIADAFERMREHHPSQRGGFVELPVVSVSVVGDESSEAAEDRPDDPQSPANYSSRDDAAMEMGDDDFELGDDVGFRGDADEQNDPGDEEESSGYQLAIPQIAAEVEEPSSTEFPAAPAEVAPPITAAAPESEAAPASEKSEREQRTSPAEHTGPAHSEATGGDVLLEIAKTEEESLVKARRERKRTSSFLVYCPRGHKVLVQERHRGKTGTCPRCKSIFVVPRKEPKKPAATAAGSESSAPVTAPSRQSDWMTDTHLHKVDPTKLRLKADALTKDFTEVDVGFSPSGIDVVTLIASAGLFGANAKKKPAIRDQVQEHLAAGGGAEGAPGAARVLIPAELTRQFVLSQPTPPDVESLFGEIPIFGRNRIAVRLPKLPEGDDKQQYFSFWLSEFRRFRDLMAGHFGITGLGDGTEVPLSDTYESHKCHYSDAEVRELLAVSYYEADPSFKLETVGWKCAGCSLIVSEDARKKEKIGGLKGTGIAKAKCPKCGQKFGNQPLKMLAAEPEPEAAKS
jgi:hypothetical protein